MSKKELQDIRKLIWAGMEKLGLNRNQFGNLLEEKGICLKQSLYELLAGKEIGCDKMAGICAELDIVFKFRK